MQDTDFNLKVTDFIAGKSFEDSIEFSNKFSTSLPHLENGLSCTISIQGGGDKTILLTISRLSYATKRLCDVCSKPFDEKKSPEDFLIKCYADYDEGLLKEDEITFDSKHGVIDLEPLFVQEILLDQSIKCVCTDCSKIVVGNTDQNTQGNNITRTS